MIGVRVGSASSDASNPLWLQPCDPPALPSPSHFLSLHSKVFVLPFLILVFTTPSSLTIFLPSFPPLIFPLPFFVFQS